MVVHSLLKSLLISPVRMDWFSADTWGRLRRAKTIKAFMGRFGVPSALRVWDVKVTSSDRWWVQRRYSLRKWQTPSTPFSCLWAPKLPSSEPDNDCALSPGRLPVASGKRLSLIAGRAAEDVYMYWFMVRSELMARIELRRKSEVMNVNS